MAKLYDPFFGEWDPAEHDSPREQRLSDMLDEAEARVAQLEEAGRVAAREMEKYSEVDAEWHAALTQLRAVVDGNATPADRTVEQLLAAVEAGHVPSLSVSDLYPEDNIRFCDLDDERWPCSAITGNATAADAREQSCRCGHPSLRTHNAGGCTACGCTSPYGGTT